MIIWINGQTSAGKTSLALALQRLMPTLYLHAELDKFISMLPLHVQQDRHRLVEQLHTVVPPFHLMISVLADSGANVIVDHVFEQRQWYEECRELCKEKQVYLIGLTANAGVLAQRARDRRDREPMLHVFHEQIVHTHTGYDLMLDSSHTSADDLAAQVITFVEKNPPGIGLYRRLAQE